MATISNDPLTSVTADNKKGHSLRHWLLFLLLFAVAAGLIIRYAWLPRHQEEQQVVAAAQRESHARPVVDVLKIGAPALDRPLSLPGTSLAYTEAAIYARASGYVSKRLVDIGDHVRKGQLLAVIDAPELDQQTAQAKSMLQQSEANLAQMEAQLRLAQANWERYKVLVSKGVFSKQEGDTQEATLRVAEANVNAMRSTVQANRDNVQRETILQQYERVTAPFGGIITARNIDVGSLISGQGAGSAGVGEVMGAASNNSGSTGMLTSSVSPSTGGVAGGAMFGISTVAPLRVLVSVPETYAPYVHLRQKASLVFQSFPSRSFEGVVMRTSSSIDPGTRTLLVEIQTPNTDGKLVPGTYVVATFPPAQDRAGVLIPGESIVIRDGKTMVPAVLNGKVHFQLVEIGRDYGDQVEILKGLGPGDIIVRTVSDAVQENVEIEPRYRNEKADSSKHS